MSADQAPDPSVRDAALQTRFRLAGILILVAGLLAAVVVGRRAVPSDNAAEAFMPADTKSYEHELERIGGKSNVVAGEIREWFGSLWHGRRLANTLTVLSIGGCLACFLAAHVLTYSPPPDDETTSPDH